MNQWYWGYSYGDYSNNNEGITFDSFMVAEDDLEEGDFRQLAVDNALTLPINTSIRMIITSNDVIHSFAVPSLGVKVDALPGRLNTTGFVINRPATLYGQCSELCGILHNSMPICIKAVSLPSYLQYIKTQLDE
jgi:cytochrome c oxidase subunit 2